MRKVLSTVFLLIVAAGCAHSPYYVSRERRFTDTIWLGLSSYIVAGSEPATDGKDLFLGTRRGTVVAFSTPNLRKLWEKDVLGSVETRPLAESGVVYVGTSKGKIYALSAKTGVAIWQQDLNGEVLGQPALYGGKLLLVGANDGYLYALDAKNGAVIWRYRKDFPDRLTIHGFATPAVLDSRLYAAFSDGTVAALKAEDGSELWNVRLASEERFADVVSPVVASPSGSVLAAQFFGTLYGLNPGGGVRWSVPSGGSAAGAMETEDRLFAPAAANRILALDPKTGDEKWKFEAKESANWTGLAFLNGRLIAGSSEGLLYVLDASDGKFVWRYNLGAPIKGPPVVVGDSLFVVTEKGVLFRLAQR
ncbi:MAG: PQQ-binding-like beta-propeller repeat protein [Pseudomonadota bacterium]